MTTSAKHFTIYCLDVPNSAPLRQQFVEEHKAYLSAAPFKILISGPLLEEDRLTINGSCFIVEAESKAQVMEFNRNDPFIRAGIWSHVEIRDFAKWRDNR